MLWRNYKINKFKTYCFTLYTSLNDSVSGIFIRLNNLKEKSVIQDKLNKEKFYLTLEQKNILIGLLLADGFLEKRKPNHNTRLRIDHTYPGQEIYVKSLYKIFKPICGKQPAITIRKPDKRTGKIYSSIAFKTYNLSCLNEFYSLFYKASGNFHLSGQPRYIKIVPSNIQDLLTPIALAH